MKVYKFGGASIANAERLLSTCKIMQQSDSKPLLVVISALGKTTNALEEVVNAFYNDKQDDAIVLFEQIKKSHLQLVKYTCTLYWQEAEAQLKDFFTEVEWMLHDKPVQHYDYYYDQIVCIGEMMSTCIVYHHLRETEKDVAWIDVRDLIRTDDNHRDAFVDWEITAQNVKDKLQPLLAKNRIVITQGFVGSTDENESTTLGREGSDFSAAIFANLLDAESLSIWKDVPGVMNGDPKVFEDAIYIPTLNYNEVIEMAYYGAQVIHPKTIKPLQNKKIPLWVKCFLDPESNGTQIVAQPIRDLPPIKVRKDNQVLFTFKSKDFSFVEDLPIKQLHDIQKELKLKANLTQNTAISLLSCFDDKGDKTDALAALAAIHFDVSVEKGLSLITIRHYTQEMIAELTGNKKIILEQKTEETVQMIVRD